jgi:predicted metalloprotease with PDZ domain
MWRGGLSAPQSMFVHSSRPLISENATSTLLHEVMHLLLRLNDVDGYDWIVEGLAEYYSLEILHRSGTISDERFAIAKIDTAEWASSATDLCAPVSSGATTALAVTLFDALNAEIRERTDGAANLDDVARILRHTDKDIDLAILVEVAEQVAGDKPDALHIDKLPGCRNIASANVNM